MNGAVLAFVALGVGYELLHVDVEAIVALFKYTLPVDRPIESTLQYFRGAAISQTSRGDAWPRRG